MLLDSPLLTSTSKSADQNYNDNNDEVSDDDNDDVDIDDESDLKRVAGKLCRGEQGRCGRHGGKPSVRLQRTGIIMISIWAYAK